MTENNITIKEIISYFLESNRIILICHVRPDGDTLACAYALKRVLENKLYSKIALMSFLDWLIARSEKVTKKNMTASIQKWRSDRAYVASYELSNSRSVKVGKIRYNQ